MFKVIKKIIKYPRLAQDYPRKPIDSSLFIGRPEIDLEKCTRCGECVERCPSRAIVLDKKENDIGINYDECVFCTLCEEICPVRAVKMTNKFELAEKDRKLLRKSPIIIAVSPIRVTMKAFLAAKPLTGSLYQNPIRR